MAPLKPREAQPNRNRETTGQAPQNERQENRTEGNKATNGATEERRLDQNRAKEERGRDNERNRSTRRGYDYEHHSPQQNGAGNTPTPPISATPQCYASPARFGLVCSPRSSAAFFPPVSGLAGSDIVFAGRGWSVARVWRSVRWQDGHDPPGSSFRAVDAAGRTLSHDAEGAGDWLSPRSAPEWCWRNSTQPELQLPREHSPLPWGINRDEVEPSPRGLPRLFAAMTNQIPVARHGVPSLVYVTFGNAIGPSTIEECVN
jgi:hypothetical protein